MPYMRCCVSSGTAAGLIDPFRGGSLSSCPGSLYPIFSCVVIRDHHHLPLSFIYSTIVGLMASAL